ncbi:MAG: O-antigen ligase family protein [Maricaulaceae bacterium]|jgi:O-antigen ligase
MPSLANNASWARGVFVLLIFAFAGLAIGAGGLGLAPLAALGGVGWAVFTLFERRAPRPNAALIAAVAFAAWAGLSFLWSAYDNAEYLLRFATGAPLYVGFFLLCKDLEGPARRLAQGGVLLCVVFSAVFLGLEAAFGGMVTASHREEVDMGQVWRNLGHGLSAWAVIAPSVVVMLLVAKRPLHAATATGLAAAGFAGAIVFGLTSNLAGLIAALGVGLIALFGARTTVAGLGLFAALGVLVAPAIGLCAEYVPAGVRNALPNSWDLRLEAWRASSEMIKHKPLFGWGFDASRATAGEIFHRGETTSVIPLHPHNLGLHAWLELGLVGALLLAAVLVLGSRAIAYAPNLTRRQGVSAAAAGGSYIAMAQISYGMWQEWWLAAIAFAAAAAALAGPSAAERAAGRSA